MDSDISKIGVKKLVKELAIRAFTNEWVGVCIVTIIPIVIPLLCTYPYSLKEIIILSFLISIIILFNFFAYNLKVKGKKEIEISNKHIKKELFYAQLVSECYNEHNIINSTSATNIYRLNNVIHKHLQGKKPIDKSVFDNLTDFETVAFNVCNSIYNIVTNKIDKEAECQVTIFKQIKNKTIKMVAFANETQKMPSTYRNSYNINIKNKKYLFIRLFNNKDVKNHYCPNREQVRKDFSYIEESRSREEKVCQYIGIPLKTNRNKIELLLQIDVSKEDVFGKNIDDMGKLTQKIFEPYLSLLHKAYERDIIFSEYYDLVVKSLDEYENVEMRSI